MVAEMLKWAVLEIFDELHRIFNTIWETEKLSEEWEMALIHPLHKKAGKQDISSRRVPPLSRLENPLKDTSEYNRRVAS